MDGTHDGRECAADFQVCFLRIETYAQSGRSHHACCAIPAGTTILQADTPYAYTIWKPFRNEVCAECWRYDGGRRGFLTCRDDDGVSEEVPNSRGSSKEAHTMNTQPKLGPGAGLWFCDTKCQGAWLRREGSKTMSLLRVLEEARRQKEVEKDKDGGFKLETIGRTEITQESVDRAWDIIAQQESSPKEVRKWRNLQLNHFETDMARYVLIALVHRHWEMLTQIASDCDREKHVDKDINAYFISPNKTGPAVDFGGARWEDFAALQSNELRHLRTYPELLENQIRAYQALKGRFSSHATAFTAERHSCVTDERKQVLGGNQESESPASQVGRSCSDNLGDFGSIVTVDNVRRAFSVDPGNSFGIWETPMTEESELMGFAVYPRPSFFNHHCSPNVTKVRKGRMLQFVTTRPIVAGEELCISYGHVESMSLEERQKELREGWFFECQCSRCVAEAET